ncbi:MAG TPA: helix-turn-helix domain-containing protein [Pedococcus sp.]|jgi:DNA-binding PucR family transcriptional regulator|uniref:helix-turn-helix domain-containing protein n=1 Tax=Pedococcus sp. TaxID=2860345 RepID=UPI002F957085
MTTDEDAALRLLRLLAEGAPASELSRAHDPDGEARELALRVRAAFDSRRRREAELTALVDTARDLASLRDPSGVLDAIVRRARALLGTDIAYLTLYDREAGDTFMRATDGSVSAEFQIVRLSAGDGLGGLVAKTHKPYWTADYFNDHRFQHTGTIDSAVGEEGLVSICGTPLLVEGEFVGVLFAANRSPRPFSPDQVALLGSLAALAAVSIVQTRAAAETAAALAQLSSAHDLVRRHTAGIERAAAAHDRFAGLVLEGGGVDDLTAALADLLGGWVVLIGESDELLSACGAESPDDDSAHLTAVVASEAVKDTRSTGRLAHSGEVWAIAVKAAQSELGVLVLGGVDELDDSDQRTLERAAVVTALVLLFERTSAEAEQRVRTDLVSDLITGRGDPSALQARARASGVDPGRGHAVLVADAQGDTPRRTLLLAAHAAAGPGSIVGEHDGRVVALVPSQNPQTTAEDLARRLRRLGPVTVGAAGPVSIDGQVPAAWAEAARTATAMGALGLAGTGASAEHLGFAGLVVGSAPDVDGYVRRHLGPLLDYDERRGSELVRTLQAYFDAGSSPRHAATSLHVHVNTVSQRLERISSLLGSDWQRPGQALELQLALRLRHLRDAPR